VDRIEEFLQNLDIKNKVLLYLSVLIFGIIIYYNFNLNYLSPKIKYNENLIKKLEKKTHLSLKSYNKKLYELKKKYKSLLALKNEKIQDLKYLNKRINLSVLFINDKKFYSLLENILNKSYDLGLNPNFYITQNFDKFKKYIIDVNGTVGICEEKDLLDFIKYLESSKYVVNIDEFTFDFNSSNYFIRYNIWGIK
jgi:hypothetical protein